MRELYQVPGVAETVKPRYYVHQLLFDRARSIRPASFPRARRSIYLRPHDRARFAA